MNLIRVLLDLKGTAGHHRATLHVIHTVGFKDSLPRKHNDPSNTTTMSTVG